MTTRATFCILHPSFSIHHLICWCEMNEDWLAVIVGLSLVGLVMVRLVGQVPW
ncbi:MAG: hypothetical protein HY581_01155 [Nitrospirae bacterium]|nr:hypothetical protein [Nitrospirota bacterium]